jgi:putative endonuclease
MTSDLVRRVSQHKTKQSDDSFTRRYNLTMLVHAESADNARAAIEREKQIKGWNRAKKFALIESANPEWRDLSPTSRSVEASPQPPAS